MIAHLTLSCDPALTRLFTPPHPQRGRYEVCTSPDTIEQIVRAGGPHYGSIEPVQALDAFGGAAPYDKSALARLYGGRRPKVARGWQEDARTFESVTLISPYPDASLTRLEAGTMEIRWKCEMQNAECKMPEAALHSAFIILH
jgi:hypothetical protein